MLNRVPVELRDRTDVIGNMHPHDPNARARFRGLVDNRLGPECGGSKLRCRLTWTDGPADLDLHLFISEPNRRHEVYFRERGALETWPHALLSEDVQTPGGGEELVIGRWIDGATYAIAVHAYSEDRPMPGSNAEVRLTSGFEQEQVLKCPADGDGRWWLVARVDGGGRLEIQNRISRSSPDNRP